jgi:predicted secreted Zn-dependent protease
MHDVVLRAVGYARAGDRETALRLLREVTRRDPSYPAAWKWLAYLSPDPREALDAAWRVLQLDPADEWAHKAMPGLIERARLSEAQPSPAQATGRRPLRLVPSALALLAVLVMAAAVGAVPFVWLYLRDAELLPTPATGLEASPMVPTPDAQAALEMAPAVMTSRETQYYTIEANDLAGVQSALYSAGPLADEAGTHSIALTSYNVWVEWHAIETGGACTVTGASVNLDIVFTYPQWQPASEPSAWLRAEWERFIAYVVQHEEYHALIAQGCAYDLAARLASLDTAATCAEVEAWLDAAIDEVYGVCEQRQAEFDAVEGRTTFPLP